MRSRNSLETSRRQGLLALVGLSEHAGHTEHNDQRETPQSEPDGR